MNNNSLKSLPVIADGTFRARVPEHELLRALLERAVRDVASLNYETSRTAQKWWESHNNEPFSANWCCDHLRVDKGEWLLISRKLKKEKYEEFKEEFKKATNFATDRKSKSSAEY